MMAGMEDITGMVDMGGKAGGSDAIGGDGDNEMGGVTSCCCLVSCGLY